jgi:hypothetical protein
VKTNRTGRYCVQIETVFTAGETVNGKKYATVRDTPCKNLDKIMAWLRSLGIPDTWPGGAPTGFTRDTVSLDAWTKLGGHYGHNQVPGNSHVDPGPMPNLFASAPTPHEAGHPAEGVAGARRVRGQARPGRRRATPATRPKSSSSRRPCTPRACSPSQYVDGSFGTKTVTAYARWQRSPAGGGYTGSAADGIPGEKSLKLLAARHGFQVVA